MIYLFPGRSTRPIDVVQAEIDAQLIDDTGLPLNCHDNTCSHRRDGHYTLTVEQRRFRRRTGSPVLPESPSEAAFALRDPLLADAVLGDLVIGVVVTAEVRTGDEPMKTEFGTVGRSERVRYGNGISYLSHMGRDGLEIPDGVAVCFDAPLTEAQEAILRGIVMQ